MFIKLLFLILTNNTPILLLPGLGGSRLIKNNIDIWPPKLSFFIFEHNRWIDQIINDKNLQTLDFGDKNALDLHTNIPLIIKKNLYEDIMSNNDNVYPIPYDFRLVNDIEYINMFNAKLKLYIESFNQPVKILTHSTGGLILHYFIYMQTEEWNNKHILEIIHVNVPFGGIIITLENLIKTTQLNLLVSKKLLKSLGAYIINMPNPKIIKPILIVDGKEVDYYRYFNLTNTKIKDMIDSFDQKNDIKTTLIYSSNVKTSSIINIKNNKLHIIKGLGDGIVPLSSLLYPMSWNKKNLNIIHLPNYDHSTVLFSKELNNILHDLDEFN